MKNKIFTLIFIIFLTANAGYSMPLAVKSVIIKFSFAMCGVILSSLLIFVGLTIYNRIKSRFNNNTSEYDEVLKHPKTKDEAIRFYIRKNKL